jgi:chromosome segregation ATPase
MREAEFNEYSARVRKFKNDHFNVKDKFHEIEKLLETKNREDRDATEELSRLINLINKNKASLDELKREKARLDN